MGFLEVVLLFNSEEEIVKKKFVVGSLICAFLMVFSFQANAALIVLGVDDGGASYELLNGDLKLITPARQLILDDATAVVWYDFTRGALKYEGALNYAATLEVPFGGDIWEDWRLPTEAEFFSMANDPAAGLFNYILDKRYWLLEDGRVFNFETKTVGKVYADHYNAIAVQAQVVPIPGAVWLLGAGLVGIIGFRRRKP